MIDVVDYSAGNGPSVIAALEHLGLPCRLVGKDYELAASERIILPGVGSAATTLESLRDEGLVDALNRRVGDEGVPFLGICIGMQILFDHSEEDAGCPCLGWLPGRVLQFAASKRRVPQIGWNEMKPTGEHLLTRGLPEVGHYYFVNSYYVDPEDPSIALGVTNYGIDFCSFLVSGNIAATQFHAEKSGPLGLRILENFAVFEGR
jgi:glutamine amidotransferase